MNHVVQILYEIAHVLYAAAVNFWPLLLVFGILGLATFVSAARWLVRKMSSSGRGDNAGNRKRPSGKAGKSAAAKPAAAAAGTLAVLEPLQKLPRELYTTFPDLYLARPTGDGTTHLDQVVVSRFGIFVIQVEEGAGEIFGREDDKQWSWMSRHKMSPVPNPLWRNRYHVRAIANFLGMPEKYFHSIIYFPGDVTFKMADLPPNVLTSGLTKHILGQQEDLLSRETVTHVNSVLDVISRTLDRVLAREEHRAAKRKTKSGPIIGGRTANF